MPESKGRKEAEAKKHRAPKSASRAERAGSETERAQAKTERAGNKPERPRKQRRLAMIDNRAWVAPTFVTVGLLGVLWLIVYYLAGYTIPFMAQLGAWNLAIGMGLMAASFAIATLWK